MKNLLCKLKEGKNPYHPYNVEIVHVYNDIDGLFDHFEIVVTKENSCFEYSQRIDFPDPHRDYILDVINKLKNK